MTFCHHTKAMTPKEVDEAFAALDRNSWEATCKYDRNGIGSPAGGMNLLYRMDI